MHEKFQIIDCFKCFSIETERIDPWMISYLKDSTKVHGQFGDKESAHENLIIVKCSQEISI